MPLPLDHIPFAGQDIDALAAAFDALGFTVTPACAYTSPDYPDARWRNRSVFLRQGWFDLLHEPNAPANAAIAPGACLFLTTDLEGAAAELGDMRLHPAYRLDRNWDDAPELGGETFHLFSIRERISPLGLAVIAHDYPCPDTRPEWFAHPNSAARLSGLIFAGGEPGPFAKAAGRVLDLSGFEHWPAESFCAAFEDAEIAVRVEVASLGTVQAALRSDLTVRQIAPGLAVLAPAPLACGFLFVERLADRNQSG